MSLSVGGPPLVSIGGTASPFLPAADLSRLGMANLTFDCQRHSNRTRRRKKAVHFQPSGNFQGMYRLGQLFCRTGYHLQIHHNGKINGTKRDDSRFGVLEFLSVAFGLVTIRGKASNQYLCMNKRGKLVGRKRPSVECVFMEKMLENYYNTYSSCAYSTNKRRWFLALNRHGKTRPGRKAKLKKRKNTNFLVLHLDDDHDSGWTAVRFDLRAPVVRLPPPPPPAPRRNPRRGRTRFGVAEDFAAGWRKPKAREYELIWRSASTPPPRRRRTRLLR